MTGFLSHFIKVTMDLAAKQVVPSSPSPTAVPPTPHPHLACHCLSPSCLTFLPAVSASDGTGGFIFVLSSVSLLQQASTTEDEIAGLLTVWMND